jgi:hypothetical protein
MGCRQFAADGLSVGFGPRTVRKITSNNIENGSRKG